LTRTTSSMFSGRKNATPCSRWPEPSYQKPFLA
jgi:hypothetical protein